MIQHRPACEFPKEDHSDGRGCFDFRAKARRLFPHQGAVTGTYRVIIVAPFHVRVFQLSLSPKAKEPCPMRGLSPEALEGLDQLSEGARLVRRLSPTTYLISY